MKLSSPPLSFWRRRSTRLLAVGALLSLLVGCALPHRSSTAGLPLPFGHHFAPLPQKFTLLLAGRDVIYCGYHLPCKNQEQRAGVQQTSQTDSIMLIRVDGAKADVLNIPRDTNVGPYDPARSAAEQKVNSRYWVGGPLALMKAVEELTGAPVDHYLIVRTDFAARVIDALGGLDVDVPAPGIVWVDHAAGVDFRLTPGPHHLGGADAVLFLRVRKGFGDDYGRMDHQKQALTELLGRLKSSRGLLAVPTILGGLRDGIETDIDPAALPGLLPRLKRPQLSFATLPTHPIPHSFNLAVDQAGLAKVWGAADTVITSAQQRRTPVLIFDATGQHAGRKLAQQLRAEGYRLVWVRRKPVSPEPSQVFTADNLSVAQALANALDLPRLQGERFPVASGQVGILLGSPAQASP